MKITVVGAGLFGSVIAAALRARGDEVEVIDDGRPNSGSVPAACLMRPSWLTGYDKEVVKVGFKTLDRLYGLHTLQFKTRLGVSASVEWCHPHEILRKPVTAQTVTRVVPDGKGFVVYRRRGSTEVGVKTDRVVLAAGVWTQALTSFHPSVSMQAMAGVAYLWPEEKVDPFIRVWAPYRQLVAFNRGDGLWVSDGSAKRKDSWSDADYEKSKQRCQEGVGLYSTPLSLFGYRPYVPSAKPCVLTETHKGLWVATGGAKNGTLLAGWCASQLAVRLT